ncbi:hypothetical protein N825_12295 [Skermanella stibiiresistens SB22]|uniref:Gamma-glutamyltransferase n=1 Tax=Skermanella stibiiresistens SB22 TaxID=1385369 RepID=W9GXP0_9PROT|nr:gamma-glutamyltransferase family protein [Skermanella stibiiresistens]EWY38584.1 hypothetical protein N825_12295 [Skermanella stibiiresistens SB22]
MTSERSFRIIPNDDVTFYPRVFGRRGVVASHHTLSAAAGLDALKAGGNAVDAAVAATFVEGVLNPNMHTIGGECPILVALASGGVICVNGNTMAPGKATPETYRSLGHDAIPSEGILAAGVPAAFGALVVAASRYGRLSFADLVRPALELARDGFPVHAGLLRQHKFGIVANADRFLSEWASTGAVYMPGGGVPAEGSLLTNPALAAMFAHLAAEEVAAGGGREHGLRAVFESFYRGDVAREIVAFSKDQGGLLERSDFDAFEIPLEDPVSLDFAGARIHKCPAWNQGPALLQSLSILKAHDLEAMGHNGADYVHTVTEAMKLAFADREQYYGDTRHGNIPIEDLLDDAYGLARAGLIDPAVASAELRPGDPTGGKPLLDPSDRFGGASWGAGTVHVDTADAEGNLCSFTPSGAWIKSSPVIPALGFPLGNRISNFHLGPAHHPNVIAPFKRPRTTISPTIVTRGDEPWIACGSMGGDQQDQWQLQFLLNRLVFGMPLQRAIEAPKFSSEHFPGFFAPHSFFTNRLRAEVTLGPEVLAELARRGHDVSIGPAWSEGFMLAVERPLSGQPSPMALEAGCDPRGAKSEVFPAAAVAW